VILTFAVPVAVRASANDQSRDANSTELTARGAIAKVRAQTAVFPTITRLEAKKTTWGEYVNATHDAATADLPSRRNVVVVAVAGDVVPSFAHGETYRWGVMAYDATTRKLLGLAAGTEDWPAFFDALRGRAVAGSGAIGSSAAPTSRPAPELGTFPSQAALVAALLRSGPLDNMTPASVAAGTAPGRSICADFLPSDAGTLIHEAAGAIEGDHAGVVFVLRDAQGNRQIRLYSTGDADPASGQCRLIFATNL